MTSRLAALPSAASRSVTILGCSGSIGSNALNIIRRHRQRFQVKVLTAHTNVDALAQAALEFSPELAVIGQETLLPKLKAALEGTRTKAATGPQALLDAASFPSDMVMAAIVGAAGLAPTMAAIRRGATVLLANKECLVCAGDLLMREMTRTQARLLPVDSEHSAIFQIFDFDRPETVDKITITASGGPFRNLTREQMRNVTPQQAVKHPNWSMGAKISVDSATLMNKGLEVIEAYHLFPVKKEQIEVVVHPESIVHGMVSYRDGSVLAQMAAPDMATPIAYALAWPERIHAPTPPLDWAKLGCLTFEAPDEARFPALNLAREALKSGGSAPCILNAANEVAVDTFLQGKIGFLEIPSIIERTLAALGAPAAGSLEEILALDAESRRRAMSFI